MAVMDYRTRDGIDDYGFSIEFRAEKGWQVYIVFQPFRHGQDDSPCLPYQSIDDNGRLYIDWSGRLDSLGEAKTVAELWAELVQRYRHVQEQRALYVELIARYQRAQEQRKSLQVTVIVVATRSMPAAQAPKTRRLSIHPRRSSDSARLVPDPPVGRPVPG